MAWTNIANYRGWHVQANISAVTSSSITVESRIYAEPQYDCNWNSRQMTLTCNGVSEYRTINAMKNSGNAYSNTVEATFSGLAGGTTYTITITYPVQATLSGVYQASWSGTIQATTSVQYYTYNMNILNPDGSEPYTTGEAGTVYMDGYGRIYDQPYSSYAAGSSITYRDFIPGTGRYLSSVSNLTPNNTSGPWSVTINSDITTTFRTAWNTYTISYAANGGSSTPSPQTKTHNTGINLRAAISRNNSYPSGYTVSFNGNGGTYSGSSKTATNTTTYSFTGWKSGNSGTVYNGGAWFTEEGNVTMTAQWSSSTTKGSITLPSSSTVSRTYYTFAGWNTNSSGTGTNYSGGSSYTPSSSTTLYAKWTANAPTDVTLTRSSSTTDSITFTYTDTGIVTSRTVYYRKAGASSYSSKTVTASPFTITGLDVDTDYEVYYKASNSDNSKSTSIATYSTLLTSPTITNVDVSDVTPFTATITVNATITPTRNFKYRFSKDGGTNWTELQTSNTYTWEDLEEETLYNMAVRAIALHVGTNSSSTWVESTVQVITPADQARAMRKINGEWVQGKAYYKVGGEWVKAKKIYIKKNGEWVVNTNQY